MGFFLTKIFCYQQTAGVICSTYILPNEGLAKTVLKVSCFNWATIYAVLLPAEIQVLSCLPVRLRCLDRNQNETCLTDGRSGLCLTTPGKMVRLGHLSWLIAAWCIGFLLELTRIPWHTGPQILGGSSLHLKYTINRSSLARRKQSLAIWRRFQKMYCTLEFLFWIEHLRHPLMWMSQCVV